MWKYLTASAKVIFGSTVPKQDSNKNFETEKFKNNV